MERSVCFQFVDHLKANGLYEKLQFAYTEGRSCATALLVCLKDIKHWLIPNMLRNNGVKTDFLCMVHLSNYTQK